MFLGTPFLLTCCKLQELNVDDITNQEYFPIHFDGNAKGSYLFMKLSEYNYFFTQICIVNIVVKQSYPN